MEKEFLFLQEQADTEINAGHFSALFRTELLPGMCSPLVHAVLKPKSETMQLVVDHSSRDFSPNSMITHENIAGIQLDGLCSLSVSLMQIKLRHPSANLVLYKLDISAEYRQLPMHPLYQILQVITMDSQRYIDRNNNFGGCTSQVIWQLFMSLVIWILVFRHGLGVLKCYINDTFLVTTVLDICWYEPYQRHMPTDQCKVL